MSSTDSDDVVVVTEAPSFNEHSHLYQSQVRVVEAPSPTHIPPLYPTLNTFSGIHTPTRVDPRPQVTVASRVSSRSSVRPKPLKYKSEFPVTHWLITNDGLSSKALQIFQ